jgi:hypothetical protein
MNRLLQPYRFHIFIIEQSDDGNPFNIGKLKNVGFKLVGEWEKTHDMKFTNFIFTDIDMLPDDELLQYYVKPIKKPISLAVRGTRYEQKDLQTQKIFLGGVLGFNRNDFEQINGYPDNFWGWGGEDDALIFRLVAADVPAVQIPKVGTVIDLEEKKTVEEKLKNTVKENQKWEKLYIDMTFWKNNGLNNLEYKLLKMTDENETTTQYLVDLMRREDEAKHPELYKTDKLKFDWKKDRRVITDKYANLKLEILDFAEYTLGSESPIYIPEQSPYAFDSPPYPQVYDSPPYPQVESNESQPYAFNKLFTEKEKVYYYEDPTKPPITAEISEFKNDGAIIEILDLADGRIIDTTIENLKKIPVQQSLVQLPIVKKTIFEVEEDTEDEEEKEKEKEDGSSSEKKIIINIKPE